MLLLLSVGGAISNMYAMLIARFKMFPEVKEKGMAAVPRLIAFTSEHVRVSVLSKFKVRVCKAQVEGVLFGNALFPEGRCFLGEGAGRAAEWYNGVKPFLFEI